MLSLRWLIVAAVLCGVAAIAFEVSTAALSEHRRLAPDVASRAKFVQKESGLLSEYPFLADIFEQSREIVAVGDWLPALDYAWASSSIIETGRGVAVWMGNNFVARLLSPQTFGEKAMLLGCIAILVYAGAAVYMHRQKMALAERHYLRTSSGGITKHKKSTPLDSHNMIGALVEQLSD